MSDLTAEDRAALLAASMACAHAREAVWRAYRKLREVEVRCGKTAKDPKGSMLTDRLVDAQFATVDFCQFMFLAITEGRGIEWE